MRISLLEVERDIHKETMEKISKMATEVITVAFDMKYDDPIDEKAVEEIRKCIT